MAATVRASDRRRTETPNATMTTLASPTLGATARLSLWAVEMPAGSRGPRHSFDSEQLWTVLEGEVSIIVGNDETTLGADDTVVLRAHIERQIEAAQTARLLVCGYGDAVVHASGEETPRGVPPWIA